MQRHRRISHDCKQNTTQVSDYWSISRSENAAKPHIGLADISKTHFILLSVNMVIRKEQCGHIAAKHQYRLRSDRLLRLFLHPNKSQSALEEESRTEQQSSFQTGGEIRAKAQPFAFALWPSAIKIHQARQTSSIVTHILCGRAMNCKKERESSMMLIYFHMHVLLCYSRYPELMQCITMPQLCFSHSQTFITVQVKDRDVLHAVYYYYATVFN